MNPRVAIVGGGPVGMTLALELGHRGVPCVLFEQHTTTTREPRCNLTNMRSMEHFRRLGISEQIRAAGVPADYRQDVVFTTRLMGPELHRFTYPSVAEATATGVATAFGDPRSAERPQRICQIFLEPVLRAAIEAHPLVEVCFGWQAKHIEESGDTVRVEVRGPGGATRTVEVEFLAACDGGGSKIRKGLGIAMEGHPAVSQQLAAFFSSPDLRQKGGLGEAIFWWIINPDQLGVFIAIDGRDLYTFHQVIDLESDLSSLNIRRMIRDAAGFDFQMELRSVTPWQAHQLVANQYRSGRVFLVGDAAHLLQPTGGFGMNTGIGDACDLGWKLAATLDGWGGPALLDTYEAERRPIAVRNVAAAKRNAAHLAEHRLPPQIEDPEATELRQMVAAAIESLNRKEFESPGIQLGYHYGDSRLVVPDGTPPPPDSVRDYTPDARPGARSPHVDLEEGVIFDRFGRDFTLLQVDEADPAPLLKAAATRGVPLTHVRVDHPEARALYRGPLVLIRPDQHVAWRGAATDDPLALIDRARGA